MSPHGHAGPRPSPWRLHLPFSSPGWSLHSPVIRRHCGGPSWPSPYLRLSRISSGGISDDVDGGCGRDGASDEAGGCEWMAGSLPHEMSAVTENSLRLGCGRPAKARLRTHASEARAAGRLEILGCAQRALVGLLCNITTTTRP